MVQKCTLTSKIKIEPLEGTVPFLRCTISCECAQDLSSEKKNFARTPPQKILFQKNKLSHNPKNHDFHEKKQKN